MPVYGRKRVPGRCCPGGSQEVPAALVPVSAALAQLGENCPACLARLRPIQLALARG